MSHSVKAGFKRIWDGSPACKFGWAWGPDWYARNESEICCVLRRRIPGVSFQSRAIGVGHAFTCAASELCARSVRSFMRVRNVSCFSVLSWARGVSQYRAVSARPQLCVSLVEPGSCARGVGQNKEAFALVRSTDFFRRKQARRNAETH